MTKSVTISVRRMHRRPENGVDALRAGGWTSLIRSALVGTKLLDRVVRSLFKRAAEFVFRRNILSSSFLLKPTQALMLAGIRCAGAGGGGPGH